MLGRVVLLVLCGGMIWVLLSCRTSSLSEPGGRAEDAYLALNDPDEYAWSLFFFLNHPAKPGLAGVPDLNKRFGDFDPKGSLVWETWALASGDSSEVFLPNGAPPKKWEDLTRGKEPRVLRLSKNVERQMFEERLQQRHPLKKNQKKPKGQSSRAETLPVEIPEQEIRMNRAAFDGIVKREMYSADGLEKLLQTARDKNDPFLIQMDLASKEVKAEWLPLTDESWKKRYIWREGPPGPDGKRRAYGLVALHITTKDLRNWFWADFGHVDCEEAKYACTANNGYKKDPDNDPVDTTTRGPGAAHGTNGIRKETLGTIWENYILRGTQTGFVKSHGQPTVLSNPVIESGFQKSSCITCHAFATVGSRVPRPAGNDGVASLDPHFDPGVPDPTLFQMDPTKPQPGIKYLQTDFMWAPPVLANRKKPMPSSK